MLTDLYVGPKQGQWTPIRQLRVGYWAVDFFKHILFGLLTGMMTDPDTAAQQLAVLVMLVGIDFFLLVSIQPHNHKFQFFIESISCEYMW